MTREATIFLVPPEESEDGQPRSSAIRLKVQRAAPEPVAEDAAASIQDVRPARKVTRAKRKSLAKPPADESAQTEAVGESAEPEFEIPEPLPYRQVVSDLRLAEALLALGLRQKLAVGALRAEGSLEIILAQNGEDPKALDFGSGLVAHAPSGFSRRGVEMILHSVENQLRWIWARNAGAPWNGWIEWGHLSRHR